VDPGLLCFGAAEPAAFEAIHVAAPVPDRLADQDAIPGSVEVRGQMRRLALGRTGKASHEDVDLDVVGALQLLDRMQRLVNVANEVDGELQRLDLLVLRGAEQVLPHPLEFGDDAVAAPLVLLAVAIAAEPGDVDRYVDEMPVVGLWPRVADAVGPACHRGQRMPG